jgi:glycoside/pentoside/hexuronide:cation symporter, GPH family
MNNIQTTQKLSVVEKIGYSLGDFAANLVFQTLVTFLAFFYTDVYGIPASKASFIIGTVGMVGAFVFTPLIGLIADRTKTRWGKFRPWLLWTAIPFGVIALATFSTPALSPDLKVAYAFVTYTLLLFIYAANNLPYAALSGVLTSDMKDRNSMSSYRFFAVMVAQFIIQVLLLPLVLILGDGDKAVGFHNTMMMLSIMGTICFLISFATTKERVLPIAEAKNSIAQDLSDCAKNIPWIIVLLATVLVFINLALKGGMYIYYFKYYLDEPALAAFLQNVGFNSFISGLNSTLTSVGLTEFQWPKDAPTSANSLFNACGILMSITGIGLSKKLADKYGKRNVYGISLFIATLFIFAFVFVPANQIGLVFTLQFLAGFSYGVGIPVLWAMIADVADYSEWKNNRRATATIFSAMLIGLKAGLTAGGSLGAGLLALYGYNAALATQNAATASGIKMSVSLYAAIPFFAACALLYFYKIDKKMEVKIENELNERRKAVGK